MYDRRGRLVRSVTTREPEWTEQDRAEVLALALYREGLCPLHGGPLEDCTAADGVIPDWTANSTYCQAAVARVDAENAGEQSKTPHRFAAARLWSYQRKR